MRSFSTATFCKLRTCPTSEALLLYHDATPARETDREVADHLTACDFCGAELHLLSKFPPRAVTVYQPVRIPWHIYRLAKDLLLASAGTVEAIYETRAMTLTDA